MKIYTATSWKHFFEFAFRFETIFDESWFPRVCFTKDVAFGGVPGEIKKIGFQAVIGLDSNFLIRRFI